MTSFPSRQSIRRHHLHKVCVSPVLRQELPFIARDKEAPKRSDARAPGMIKAFTDGSIRNDEVEAAAVLCRKGKPVHTLRTHKLHLGTASEHMVYEVELVDLLLGLLLIRTTGINSVRETLTKEEQRRCPKVVGSCLSNTGEQHTVDSDVETTLCVLSWLFCSASL